MRWQEFAAVCPEIADRALELARQSDGANRGGTDVVLLVLRSYADACERLGLYEQALEQGLTMKHLGEAMHAAASLKAGITLANSFPTLGFRPAIGRAWEEGVVTGMSGDGVTPISYLTLANATALSFTAPLFATILAALVLSIPGAFLALFLTRTALSMPSMIGLIMLIGLAAKNAILIVEFAKAELEKGRNIVDAALVGARLRLRPILMTSFAFILGCLPLWFASGSGAASRRILGTVVIVGMLAATSIAIFVIPVSFYLVEKVFTRTGRAQGEASSAEPQPAAGD